nr:hypothetical protein [Providencia alcalifaciens]
MKKILIAGVILGFSTASWAVPNIWSSSFAQGYFEYSITNESNDSVIIACNVGAGEGFDNGVSVYHDGQQLTGDISFLIDDEAYYIPENTTTRNGANAWVSFTDAIKKTSTFEVYVNNKPAGKFTSSPKNHKKTFSDFECDPMWWLTVIIYNLFQV